MAVGKKKECPMCGCQMIDIQACHDLCPNCGAHLDCSDGPVEDPRECAARWGNAMHGCGMVSEVGF